MPEKSTPVKKNFGCYRMVYGWNSSGLVLVWTLLGIEKSANRSQQASGTQKIKQLNYERKEKKSQMIITTIKQDHSEVTFETELYNDAELLISTILGLADRRTTITITTTKETEASGLQNEVNTLEDMVCRTSRELFEAKRKLQEYEKSGDTEMNQEVDKKGVLDEED